MASKAKNLCLFSVALKWVVRRRRRPIVFATQAQNRTKYIDQTFDETTERLFLQERHGETLSSLKTALLLGAAGFLASITPDFCNDDLSALELLSRCLIVPALCALMLYLHLHGQAITQAARLGVGLSVSALFGMMLADADWNSFTLLFFPMVENSKLYLAQELI